MERYQKCGWRNSEMIIHFVYISFYRILESFHFYFIFPFLGTFSFISCWGLGDFRILETARIPGPPLYFESVKMWPFFTKDPDRRDPHPYESRRGIKTCFGNKQSAGAPFSFESVKWRARFYARFRQKGFPLVRIASGELKTFRRRKQSAGHPFSSESVKWGCPFLHTIQP